MRDLKDPFRSWRCFAYAGTPAFEMEHTHSFAESEAFPRSPYMASMRTGFYRCRTARDGPDPVVPMTVDIKAQGATDLIGDVVAASPHPLPPGVTWARRHPAASRMQPSRFASAPKMRRNSL